ncbi:putative quinone-oxidoreductase-like protein [Abeliophyllum distichum]|uniref:Quinone-oxidoreductase-like protein n=1 Tax=Abeliophyllum distichum TaxID=126358 RepID=A0ABD1VVS8_9LAMI
MFSSLLPQEQTRLSITRPSDGAALKSPSGQKYDAVIHCATGIPWSVFEPNLSEKGKNLDAVVKLVKEGKLKTVIDSKHPLSRAEEAWAKCIDGHATGKIISRTLNQ